MKPHDLIEALGQTGTGRDKLESAREYLEGRPGATAEAMLAALEAEGASREAHALKRGWPPGTAEKARKLLAGAPLSDLLGPPPPLSQESKEYRLVKELIGQLRDGELLGRHAERQSEAQGKGLGVPQALRPEGARKAEGK